MIWIQYRAHCVEFVFKVFDIVLYIVQILKKFDQKLSALCPPELYCVLWPETFCTMSSWTVLCPVTRNFLHYVLLNCTVSCDQKLSALCPPELYCVLWPETFCTMSSWIVLYPVTRNFLHYVLLNCTVSCDQKLSALCPPELYCVLLIVCGKLTLLSPSA